MILLTILINLLLVTSVVMIHFELLQSLSRRTDIIENIKPRYRVMVSVFSALVAHIIEIAIFAFAYFLMIQDGSFGQLAGNFQGSFWDCLYFSFTTYTSLGFGDIEPSGSLRFVVGLEALTGLVLITWTASYIFLEMQRYWKDY